MTDYAPGREFGLNPVALKLMPALAGMQSERRDAPHNIDAEQALLGAIMIDPRARARAREQGLRSEDFYEPIHAELFDKFGSMLDAGRPVDAITVLSEIDGEQPIDGRTTLRQYLGELVGHRAVTTASVNNYADTIRVLAGRRRWLLAAEDAAAAARDAPASELPTVLADLQRRFDDVRPLIDGNAAEVLFDFASKASAEKAYTPLIDRVLALGTVSILIAPWQAGKTHVVVRMAYAIANGHPFMGREVLQGAVLLAPLEVRGGLDKRLVAANREYGDPGNRVAVLRGTGSLGPQPGSEAFVTKIIAAAKDLAQCSGFAVNLIVIDTLAKALAGADENAAATMAAVWAQAARITAETGATVLFTHHPPHGDSKRPRGTGDIMGGADEVLRIDREDGSDERELHSIKQRDEETGLICRFTLRTVELGDNEHGRPITTCVLEQSDAAPTRPKKPKRPKPHTAAGRALNELDHLIITGKWTEARGADRIPDGAKCVCVDDWREACRSARLSENRLPQSEDRMSRRTKTDLSASNLIGLRGDLVWLIGQVDASGARVSEIQHCQALPSEADKRTNSGHLADMSADGHGQAPIRGPVPLSRPQRLIRRQPVSVVQ